MQNVSLNYPFNNINELQTGEQRTFFTVKFQEMEYRCAYQSACVLLDFLTEPFQACNASGPSYT